MDRLEFDRMILNHKSDEDKIMMIAFNDERLRTPITFDDVIRFLGYIKTNISKFELVCHYQHLIATSDQLIDILSLLRFDNQKITIVKNAYRAISSDQDVIEILKTIETENERNNLIRIFRHFFNTKDKLTRLIGSVDSDSEKAKILINFSRLIMISGNNYLLNLVCMIGSPYHRRSVLEFYEPILTSEDILDLTTQDIQTNDDNKICQICLDNKIRIMFGCGHFCTCVKCFHDLLANDHNCPICRSVIKLAIIP